MPLLTKHRSHMTNKKTITSKDFKRVFWINHNRDFCCSPVDAQQQVDYVSSWIARTTKLLTESEKAVHLEHVFEIYEHLVIVSMGGYSSWVDKKVSIKDGADTKQTQPLPKQ